MIVETAKVATTQHLLMTGKPTPRLKSRAGPSRGPKMFPGHALGGYRRLPTRLTLPEGNAIFAAKSRDPVAIRRQRLLRGESWDRPTRVVTGRPSPFISSGVKPARRRSSRPFPRPPHRRESRLCGIAVDRPTGPSTWAGGSNGQVRIGVPRVMLTPRLENPAARFYHALKRAVSSCVEGSVSWAIMETSFVLRRKRPTARCRPPSRSRHLG